MQIPPICPYCQAISQFVDSKVIYLRSYGMIYLCSNYPKCDAYVGVHKGTSLPLGTMANGFLRDLRKRAHAVFDPLVERKMQRDKVNKNEAKKAAYQWLASELNIPAQECHIAMFDEDRCRSTIKLCSRYSKKNLNQGE